MAFNVFVSIDPMFPTLEREKFKCLFELRYIKDWVIWGTVKNEGGWSISVSMQPFDTKLSKKEKLVTKALFDKQLSQ